MLAFLGSWVIFAGGAEFHGHHLLGDLLVLLAGFLLGIVMVFSKFLIRHLTAFEVVVWQMIYGVPAFFLLSFWMEQEHSYNVPASVAVALFYQGAIVAAFCFVAWTGLLRRHSVSQVSAFNFTTPLLGVLLSWALLAEPVSSGFVLGVLLIALGIYLVARGRDDWGGRRLASKPVAGVSMAAPPPETLAPFEKETSIASAMIIASSADRAMTVREWDPVFQRSAWGMVPVGHRSLTVTALSTGEGCCASSWLKFQLSGPPAVLPHSREKLPATGDLCVTAWGRVVRLSPRNLASCC